MVEKRGTYIDRPLISVIVPVYNVESYLKKCIESIIKQSYQNLEIILVIDGEMKDRSLEICQYFLEKDNRIQVIQQKHAGISSARNSGLASVKGKYIGFVDSDDWIEYTMYEDLFYSINQYHAEIAVCNYFYEEKNRSKKRKTARKWEKGCLSRKEALKRLASNDIESFCWNKLFKANLFKNIVFPNTKIYEDVAVMHKIFARSERVAIIQKPEYHYIRHAGSLIRKGSLEDRLNALEILHRRHDFLLKIDKEIADAMCPAVYSGYVSLAAANIRAGLKKKRCFNKRREIITYYFKDNHMVVQDDPYQRKIMNLFWRDSYLSDGYALLWEIVRRRKQF